MFAIEKEFRFEASHVLPHHGGKCARLHGHSWKAVVAMESDRLVETGPQEGMVVDYGVVKAIVQPIVDGMLDHRHLNDIPGLENPTSEALARWLYLGIKPLLNPESAVRLAWVRIEETCTSACVYTED